MSESLDAVSPAAPAAPQPPSRRARLSWLPRDILLVVVGAALALVSEEWRDARKRRSQVETALSSIRDELRNNQALVIGARQRHAFLADTLAKLVASRQRPTPQIYENGMVKPANVSSTAWQLARQTGVLSDVPLSVLLAIAPAYDAQDRYRAMTDALAIEMMTEIRRNGMEGVLRDRFAQFIPLDIDFGNREGMLLEKYEAALKPLSPGKP